MGEEILQVYNVELEMYRGHKIVVGKNSCVELHLKGGDPKYRGYYFDVKVFVGEQKTLSSTNPTYARLETLYGLDNFETVVKAGQKFYLKDPEISMKVGTGHVLEILPPE